MDCNKMPYLGEKWRDITSQITVGSGITAGGVYAFAYNGMVYVFISTVVFRNNGDSQNNLITGLPKAKCQAGAIATGLNSGATKAVYGDVCWINTGGTEINFHISANTYQHWFSLFYISDEV